MDLERIFCPFCGGEGLKKEGEIYKCGACGNSFRKKITETELNKTLTEKLDELELKHYSNEKFRLWQKTHEDLLSNDVIKDAISKVKKYNPDDFWANFYEVAVFSTIDEICDYLTEYLKNGDYSFADEVIRFLIKTAESDRILQPLIALLNKAEFEYEKRLELQNGINELAEKLNNGVFMTSVPRDAFICYSSKDIDKVAELVDYIEKDNLKCFYAQRNLRHGKGAKDNYEKELQTAMSNCKCIVFVSSKNSRRFDCAVFKEEIPYLKKNEPYKPRIQYVIDSYEDTPDGVKAELDEFFAGQEWCTDKGDLERRIFACRSGFKDDEKNIKKQLSEIRKKEKLRAQLEEEKRIALDRQLEEQERQLALARQLEEQKKQFAMEEEKRRREIENERKRRARGKRIKFLAVFLPILICISGIIALIEYINSQKPNYQVEYYIQTLDGDYIKRETLKLKGTPDTTASAEIKEYEHFTYDQLRSTVSGNIESDRSLVLKVYYTRDSYTLSVGGNDSEAGTFTDYSGIYKFDHSLTLTATTNVGYSFDGWYNGQELLSKKERYTFNVDKSLNITAKWTCHIPTVIFDAKGGTLSKTKYLIKEPSPVEKPIPIKEGATFSYWSTEDGKGKVYDFSKDVVSSFTLYAVYIENPVSVIFEKNNGDSRDEILSEKNSAIGEIFSSILSPKRTGYIFGGWYRDDGTFKESVSSNSVFSAEQTVVYAKWVLAVYHIVYKPNGGTLDGTEITQYTVENIVELPSIQHATYPGYRHFEGWYSDSSLTQPFTNDLSSNPRDITLYAKWDECAVYKIDNIPETLTSSRVILDWSHVENGAYDFHKMVYAKNVSELYVIGNPNAVYDGVEISLYAHSEDQKNQFVHFNRVNMKGFFTKAANSVDLAVTIDVLGNNVIEAPNGKSVMEYNSVTFTGGGDLTLQGGNGDKSANGCNAIKVSNVTLNMSGDFTCIGGNGGNGGDGASYTIDNNRWSTWPGNGGNGGNGGYAIECDVFTVLQNNKVKLQGGNGGKGGNGGNLWGAVSQKGQPTLPKGGNGGQGGNGGFALKARTYAISGSDWLEMKQGDGGQGGNGGKGGDCTKVWTDDRDYPGNGGDAGRGGYGATSGAAGTPGSGGHDHYYNYDASQGNSASETKNSAFSDNGHNYCVVGGNCTWDEANALATAMGGHLVTLTSEAEQNAVEGKAGEFRNRYNTAYWIGLTDIDEEGTWAWVTGEPVSYTNWDSGEPNGGRKENYAASYGLWNDVGETSEQGGFIVEFDPVLINDNFIN